MERNGLHSTHIIKAHKNLERRQCNFKLILNQVVYFCAALWLCLCRQK